jgi:hypothetical protein
MASGDAAGCLSPMALPLKAPRVHKAWQAAIVFACRRTGQEESSPMLENENHDPGRSPWNLPYCKTENPTNTLKVVPWVSDTGSVQ